MHGDAKDFVVAVVQMGNTLRMLKDNQSYKKFTSHKKVTRQQASMFVSVIQNFDTIRGELAEVLAKHKTFDTLKLQLTGHAQRRKDLAVDATVKRRVQVMADG